MFRTTHTQIQKQVHPHLDVDEAAVEYLEALIYQLLTQMCAAQPKTLQDVETHVMATFTHPINLWSLGDANQKMDRHAVRKRGVFIFPIEKIYQQLQKVCWFSCMWLSCDLLLHRKYLATRLIFLLSSLPCVCWTMYLQTSSRWGWCALIPFLILSSSFSWQETSVRTLPKVWSILLMLKCPCLLIL